MKKGKGVGEKKSSAAQVHLEMLDADITFIQIDIFIDYQYIDTIFKDLVDDLIPFNGNFSYILSILDRIHLSQIRICHKSFYAVYHLSYMFLRYFRAIFCDIRFNFYQLFFCGSREFNLHPGAPFQSLPKCKFSLH